MYFIENRTNNLHCAVQIRQIVVYMPSGIRNKPTTKLITPFYYENVILHTMT